jgi:hypothetical protein
MKVVDIFKITAEFSFIGMCHKLHCTLVIGQNGHDIKRGNGVVLLNKGLSRKISGKWLLDKNNGVGVETSDMSPVMINFNACRCTVMCNLNLKYGSISLSKWIILYLKLEIPERAGEGPNGQLIEGCASITEEIYRIDMCTQELAEPISGMTVGLMRV